MKKSIIILFLILASCTPDSIGDRYNPIKTTISGDSLTFLELLNNYRISKGLNPLVPEVILTQECETHADHMSETGEVNHKGFTQRMRNSKAITWGECVAGRFITVESMLAGFKGSPSHNRILIDPDKTHVGIGIKDGYICVELASYRNSNSNKQKPLVELSEPLINNSNRIATVTVTNYAGVTSPAWLYMQNNGLNNGNPATFRYVSCVAAYPDGTLITAEDYQPSLRKVGTDGKTMWFSGVVRFVSPSYIYGDVNGSPQNAMFNNPKGLCYHRGFVYVAEYGNNKVKQVDATGYVKTVAGSGAIGYADGTETTAQFKSVNALWVDAQGIIWVADGNRIRRIGLDGNVTTVAGSIIAGNTIGSIAISRFRNIEGITGDNTGSLYISDADNNCVKKINLTTGQVSLVSIPNLITPSGILFNNGSLFVCDRYGNVVFKDGIVWAEGFNEPCQITADAQGVKYVANRSGQNIKKISEQ